jgi:hypothetical protein
MGAIKRQYKIAPGGSKTRPDSYPIRYNLPMPAVQMEKLRLESANLAGKFAQPDLFRYEFLELMDRYSDRTFRSSQVTLPGKLLASFHVPDRVMWQIKNDLEPQVRIHTQSIALDCCQLLWNGDTIEEKQLAIAILGVISSNPPGPIIDLVLRFYHPEMDPYLGNKLVADGLTDIRRNHFDLWLDLIQNWIASDDVRQTAQAYQALTGLLKEEGDRHLPAVHRIVRESIFTIPPDLHPEALLLVQAMTRVSLIETKYMLRQLIHLAPQANLNFKRLIRKMVDLFSEPDRTELRADYLERFKRL